MTSVEPARSAPNIPRPRPTPRRQPPVLPMLEETVDHPLPIGILPQRGIPTSTRHFTQPEIPTYSYSTDATWRNLIRSDDSSLIGHSTDDAFRALDNGARISYAREGDTRNDALSRPILAAPPDWRGWADMRARVEALNQARQGTDTQRTSRAERAQRRDEKRE